MAPVTSHASTNDTSTDGKIVRIPDLDYVPDRRGTSSVFYEWMSKHHDKIAQIDVLTGEKDNYASLLRRCVRTAITMRSRGISEGDMVSFCTHNHLDSCVPVFATTFLGAKISTLDPSLSADDIKFLLKLAHPKIIFVSPQMVDIVEEAITTLGIGTEIVVFGRTTKHVPFTDFVAPKPDEHLFRPYEVRNLNETLFVFFSSGTTGLPKGICISHGTYLGQIAVTSTRENCFDRILAFATFYWVTCAFYWGVALFKGTTRLIAPRFDSSSIWNIIEVYQPTFMFMAPSQLLAMYDNRPYNPEQVSSSLKDISISGGPLSTQQVLKVRNVLPHTRIYLSYGQSEVCGFIAHLNVKDPKLPELMEKYPETCGTGVPGMSYKIVDLETEELLGPNQQGELRIKTPYQLTGYYGVSSDGVWDSDGWLITGDIAYYNDEGCFFIVGRVKEMLKFQSFHVVPAVIESVLLSHPEIELAMVFGVPHDVDGDHPMAVVVLKKSSTLTEEKIIKYVEERVHDRQRLRAGVKIMESLPLTPSGKIKRKEVKQMIFQQKQLVINNH